MKKSMHKGKSVRLDFRVKSAEELATQLGLSKKRTHRILTIVEQAAAKSPAARRSGKRSVAAKRSNPRIGPRTNATVRKAAKAAR